MNVTGTYLERIVADVRARLDADAAPRVAAQPGLAAAAARPATRSLRVSIERARSRGSLAVVAEVKRRSPSVGAIDLDADPARRAAAYADAGAAGISVLTEPDHFGGSLGDLAAARASAGAVPILRKDFIIDRSQLDAACAAGADAVLLIAALHGADELSELVEHARALALEVLLEVHDELDLERALETSAALIGINNRDLRSFRVDLAVTERLAPLVPAGRLVVAESGVRSASDAARLRRAGADAILVGEALMRAARPEELLRELAGAST